MSFKGLISPALQTIPHTFCKSVPNSGLGLSPQWLHFWYRFLCCFLFCNHDKTPWQKIFILFYSSRRDRIHYEKPDMVAQAGDWSVTWHYQKVGSTHKTSKPPSVIYFFFSKDPPPKSSITNFKPQLVCTCEF